MQPMLSDRERRILDILADDAGISVSGLGERLEVSSVTVRSDLKGLAEKGFIVRTKGGAFPAFHPNILERQKSMVEEKKRVAKAAAGLIEDGDNVIIVAGTTAGLIVKYLLGKRDVHIVTNSTMVLPYGRINPSLRITFVGGEFRPSAEAMVGPIALRELEQFHVDKAFVGTDGFSVDHGLTAHLVELAEIVKKTADQAGEIILVADSSKYGKAGFAHILPLSRVGRIVIDDGLKDEDREVLRNGDADLVIV